MGKKKVEDKKKKKEDISDYVKPTAPVKEEKVRSTTKERKTKETYKEPKTLVQYEIKKELDKVPSTKSFIKERTVADILVEFNKNEFYKIAAKSGSEKDIKNFLMRSKFRNQLNKLELLGYAKNFESVVDSLIKKVIEEYEDK